MFYYARSDTHFLLYIYDRVRNELVERSDRSDPEKDLIEYTLQRSKETSLDRYNPFAADPETGEGARGWSNFLYKSHIRLSGEQFAVYRALHKWRDEAARQQDENPTFIMPPQVVMEIAKILPNDPKALWSLLGNSSSQKAKQSVEDLFSIVTEARKAGAEGPSTIDFFRSTYLDSRSVAAVAKRELGKEKPELDLPPVEELRSEKSQLFGSIPLSSLWDGSSQSQNGAVSEQIALPWTQFVQEAVAAASQQETQFKSQDRDVDMIPLEVTEKAASAPKKDLDVDNTEFTLRQGRKRKVEEIQDEDSGDGGAPLDTEEMISLDVDEGGDKRTRREKKKAAKEAKNAKKQAKAASAGRNGAEQVDAAEDEDVPFDYSQAQSVLNAKRSATAAANGTGDVPGKKKAFDPYAARMNAEGPKAARRMHGERTGKAGTWKK